MYSGAEFIRELVPTDHSRQISTTYFADRVFESNAVTRVLDLGCGTGESVDYFRRKNPEIQWVGLDIENSHEVLQRVRRDADFLTYNGDKIPFEDGSFDLVFCNQVYEHVRRPFALIHEVDRVLRRGGYFVGSISYLEPFHSLSVCNFTPYGFTLLLSETNLNFIEIRPGIDVLTVLMHRLTGKLRIINKMIAPFFTHKESPVNFLIGLIGRISGRSHQEINLIKLLFSGQFRFIAKKE